MDKNLKYFLASLAVLVLLAAGVFAVRNQQASYLTDNTPQAVVHNYLLAVQRQDAAMLHSLLLPSAQTPSVADVAAALAAGDVSLGGSSVQVLDSHLLGDQAVVTLRFWQSGGLLDSGYSYDEPARLQQVDGRWYVVQMPYPLWSWNWGEEGALKR